ncbi:MAG TPA: hypothetical protein VGQ83_05455 [Polyangia bacterium]|jgi:hypothetical protein
MPRSHKDPLKAILAPIADRFAAEISAAVMDYVEARVRDEVQAVVDRTFGGQHDAPARGPRRELAVARPERKVRVCRVPGCGRPSKGPRFDFFCEVHRDLPAAEKEAIKKAQAQAPAGAEAAAESAAPAGEAPAPRARKNGARKRAKAPARAARKARAAKGA